MRKKLFVSLISWLLSVQLIEAADLIIECSDFQCTKSDSEPIFSQTKDGFWYPGKMIRRTISLKNLTDKTETIAVRGERKGEVILLEEGLQLSVLQEKGEVWVGKIRDFYNLDKLEVGVLAPGEMNDLYFEVAMIKEADDRYRGEKTVFNMDLGFWREEGRLGEAISTVATTEGEVAGTAKKPINFWLVGLILALAVYVMIRVWRRWSG